MDTLGFDLSSEAVLNTLTEEAVKTSEIEGEILCPDQVRSSVARRLGLEVAGLPHPDRAVEGIVELMLDATQGYAQPLTEDRLFTWHACLFPTGYSGLQRITAGGWRDEPSDPMQVVSGPIRTRGYISKPRRRPVSSGKCRSSWTGSTLPPTPTAL